MLENLWEYSRWLESRPEQMNCSVIDLKKEKKKSYSKQSSPSLVIVCFKAKLPKFSGGFNPFMLISAYIWKPFNHSPNTDDEF